MGLLILAFLASTIPAVILYLWLKKQDLGEESYPVTCKKALISGMLCVFAVILVSAVLDILGKLLPLKEISPIVYAAYYSFCVLAFAEELVKFLAMRRLVKKYPHSWLSTTVFMILVGLGFQVIESIPYAIGSGAGHMLVRGITMMHAAFGFVVGYFYAKTLTTGNKSYAVIGFILAWLMHGAYDFGLNDTVSEYEFLGFISLALAAFSVVLIILMIRFVRKRRTDERYTALIGAPQLDPVAPQRDPEAPPQDPAAQPQDPEDPQ